MQRDEPRRYHSCPCTASPGPRGDAGAGGGRRGGRKLSRAQRRRQRKRDKRHLSRGIGYNVKKLTLTINTLQGLSGNIFVNSDLITFLMSGSASQTGGISVEVKTAM